MSAGDTAALWREFGPRMRAAMKDSATFAATTANIVDNTGPIDSVLSEEVETRDTLTLVRTRCRFARLPVPGLLIMAFAPDGRVEGLTVRPDITPTEAPSTLLDYHTRTPLELPFHGEWVVIWGGRTIDQNRRAASRSQRFAHDLVMMKGGATHRGRGERCEDYYCYGQPVLAPGPGVVMWAADSLPDQTPGSMHPEHPIGNGVVIDHGNGEFSLLAHLQPRSLRVEPGDRVKGGQVRGRCGNSGNTSEPHLHYHLQNRPQMADAEGLPAQFFVWS